MGNNTVVEPMFVAFTMQADNQTPAGNKILYFSQILKNTNDNPYNITNLKIDSTYITQEDNEGKEPVFVM